MSQVTKETQLSLLMHDQSKDYFDHLCHELKVEPNRPAWPDRFGASLLEWRKRSRRKVVRTLSLFSGVGGLDIAFHDAGFSIATLVEIDERFANTLQANTGKGAYLGTCEVLCMDVRDFDPTDLEVDFVIGGPPCQSFSAAARRASGVSGINDDRGVLFREYARLLDKFRPKGFLFENVYGITGANNGKAWSDIQAAFEDVGYCVSHRILDAADYGVPQHRERMFIVGTASSSSEFRFPRPTHGPDSLAARPYYSAAQAVRDATLLDEDAVPSAIGGRYAGLLEQVPPGLNYSFFTEKMGHPHPVFAWRSKFSDFLYKADPDTPVRTLKAQGGQCTGPFHWSSRPFSVSELKRLQTIPDSYNISGGRQAVIHQIGNSVPPQLGRLLALSVLDQLFTSAPPHRLDYLRHGEELGFRARKRALTSVYRHKASHAIASQTTPSRRGDNNARKYYAVLKSGFELAEVPTRSDSHCSVTFKRSDSKWQLHVAGAGRANAKAFECRIHAVHTWALPVAEVVLTGNAFTREAFTGAWKAFEAELIRQNVKADLVQLCGYYQYEPAIATTFTTLSDVASSHWSVLQLVSEGVGVRSTTRLDELAFAWDVPLKDVLSHCLFLKKLGFEVRNSNTNPEIPSDCFLVPYAFPTLSPKSVQLRKHLLN